MTKNWTEKSKEEIDLFKKKISGENAHHWKGNNAAYSTIHIYLVKHNGRATHCENPDCQGKSRRFEWALKPGHQYTHNIEDYLQLCKSCHVLMDMSSETPKKISEALKDRTFSQTHRDKLSVAARDPKRKAKTIN